MKNLTRKIALMVAFMAMLAASVSAGELWDAAKNAASNAVQTVKEKGPGWAAAAKDKASEAAEVVKEKGPEVLEKAKETISDAQEQFSNWNAGQRDQFNDWFNTMTNGAGSVTPRDNPEITQAKVCISEDGLDAYGMDGIYYYDPNENTSSIQQTPSDGMPKNDIKAGGMIGFVKNFISATMLATIRLAGG